MVTLVLDRKYLAPACNLELGGERREGRCCPGVARFRHATTQTHDARFAKDPWGWRVPLELGIITTGATHNKATGTPTDAHVTRMFASTVTWGSRRS